MANYSSDQDCLSSHIETLGHLELDSVEALLKVLREERTKHPNKKVAIVDVGANIGWYT
jgi:hypothetical protein